MGRGQREWVKNETSKEGVGTIPYVHTSTSEGEGSCTNTPRSTACSFPYLVSSSPLPLAYWARLGNLVLGMVQSIQYKKYNV